MSKFFTFFLTLILIVYTPLRGAEAIERRPPFQPGEKLTFQVRWAFMPAGEAVLEVLPDETINGVRTRHFGMFVRTYAYIDPFYMVRDRIDSYTDAEITRAIRYMKRSKGRSKRDVVVHFDWEKKVARYSDFGQMRDPIPIFSGSFDPLSVFYAFRFFELMEGGEIAAPVTDGKKSVIGTARVIRRDKVRVPCGEYDAYLVEPDLKHLGGVFKKSKNARLQIWVTADDRRIPIRIRSKVKVGSFVADLVSVENTDRDPK